MISPDASPPIASPFDASPDLPIVTAFSSPDDAFDEDEPRHVSPQFDRHARFEGKTDSRRRRKLKEISKTLPRSPGVYFFYGTGERLLYIGKAKCLRERVGSYFGETSLRRPRKIRRLLAEIRRIEHQVCGSELEALLVERRLIAERLPILNRQHKRFEVYPYLLLSRENFPRLTVTRTEPLQKDEGGKMKDEFRPDFSSFILHPSSFAEPHVGELPGLYLGPFTSPRHAYWTFEAVRNLFPLRSCEGAIAPDLLARGCFYHEINRCAGPCVGATSEDEYSKLCDDLVQLLQTGNAPQLDALRLQMQQFSDGWKFEEAAQIKLQLEAIEAVSKRLQRLQRMRETNNVVVVQGACDEMTGFGVSGFGSENASQSEVASSQQKPSARPQTLNPKPQTCAATVFLIGGGVVRRRIVVRDWVSDEKMLRRAIAETYENPPPVADYTAKTELDEMMILDRWLKANGAENCCIWMNEKPNRQWTSNVLRGVRRWMNVA